MSILTKIESQSWFRKRIIITLSIFMLSLIILEIWVVNRLSTYGEQINKVEQTKADLFLENQILESQLFRLVSLRVIEGESAKLGFEKAAHIEFIKSLDLASR